MSFKRINKIGGDVLIYDDVKCTKSTCEKYTLRFNKNWDWAVFTIDDTGLFSCHSSFGDYTYKWGSFGDSFKKFLIGLKNDTSYLLGKIAKQDYFDFDEYINNCKRQIIKLRKEYELDAEQARELWNFFDDELEDYNGSIDLVWRQLYENSLLNELYDGEIHYSEFAPELDYNYHAKAFVNEIFPMFVKILEEELKEENKNE